MLSEMGASNFSSQNTPDTLFILCDGDVLSKMTDYRTTPCQNPDVVSITHTAVTSRDVT